MTEMPGFNDADNWCDANDKAKELVKLNDENARLAGLVKELEAEKIALDLARSENAILAKDRENKMLTNHNFIKRILNMLRLKR